MKLSAFPGKCLSAFYNKVSECSAVVRRELNKCLVAHHAELTADWDPSRPREAKSNSSEAAGNCSAVF